MSSNLNASENFGHIESPSLWSEFRPHTLRQPISIFFVNPAQENGKIRFSNMLAESIYNDSRFASRAPFAFAMVEAGMEQYMREQNEMGCKGILEFEFDLGHYSTDLQVWLYHPEFQGSSGMVPVNRRVLDSSELDMSSNEKNDDHITMVDAQIFKGATRSGHEP